MDNPRVSSIKREQKESLLFQEISRLFLQLVLDEPSLQGLSVSRVKLSADKGLCWVFLYTDAGQDVFKEQMKTLILYKPSMRKAISTRIPARYVPNIAFKFDAKFEKQQRIEQLLESIKTEES
jgi:ribosome-binding factor A